ncbi:Phage integrase family protein [compost metagenome]
MAQSNEILVDGKRYFLPPVNNRHYKDTPVLKTPDTGDWYIYFNIWDFDLGKWKPQKFYSKFLNNKEALRFKTKERLHKANIICADCYEQLKLGINPKTAKAIAPFSDKTLIDALADTTDDSPVLKVKDAVPLFIKIKSGEIGKNEAKENKENTASTYKSFFNRFLAYCENEGLENTKMDKIQRHQVAKFLDDIFATGTWVNVTYNNHLGYMQSFFNFFAKKYDYKNVTQNIEDKEDDTDSDRFEPFTEQQIRDILHFCDNPHTIVYPHYTREVEADKFMGVLIRTIFYSFLRPSEISRLKIRHVKRYKKGYFDLSTDITKNKKSVFNELYIDPFLVEIYSTLGWEKFFENKKYDNYYIFTKDLTPSLEKPAKYNFSKRFSILFDKVQYDTILVDTIVYKVLRKEYSNGITVKKVKKIIKKEYDDDKQRSLYSVKHTGNIIAYKTGFDIVQLQLQNRHSSIQMTENYLRKLRLEINESARPQRPRF